MHVALYHEIETKLVPALQQLHVPLLKKRNIHLIILLKLDGHIYKMQHLFV